MKPTEKQKKVINILIDILKSWRDSNDIDSPTLNSDLEESLEELNDYIASAYLPNFRRIVTRLFLFIKNLDVYGKRI